jgi:hypothetical protein
VKIKFFFSADFWKFLDAKKIGGITSIYNNARGFRMSEKEERIAIDLRIAEELFRDDVLGQIYECYARKDFLPSVDNPIDEGAVVIGAMTEIEKAMYSVSRRAADIYNAMIKAHEVAMQTCDNNCEVCTIKIDGDEVVRLNTIAESGFALMWGSMRRRLRVKACGSGIGMAADYQIVRIPPREITEGIAKMVKIGSPRDLMAALAEAMKR